VRTAYLDSTRGYFNGSAVFLCPEGREASPCSVEIAPPAGPDFAHWEVATTLPRATALARGFGAYQAASYDELIDHPVETSDFDFVGFQAGGVAHEVAITGRHDADLPRLARDLTRICQWQIDLFGEAPFEPLPVPGHARSATATAGSSTAPARASCAGATSFRTRATPRSTTSTSTFSGSQATSTSTHGTSSASSRRRFVPYDLTREAYTRQLWAFEGFTSYYDDLALVRCGLIDSERYLELLGRTITTVMRVPGRHAQSIADSSFDAWIKFYRPDENTPNSVVSYYAKGSLVGCALDLELRRDSRTTLDELMRTLWATLRPHRCRRSGRRHSQARKRARGTRSVRVLRALCRRHGRSAAGLAPCRFRDRTALAPHVQRQGPRRQACRQHGARAARWAFAHGAEQKVATVFKDGPAAKAGLSGNDTLVAIAGLKATPERIATMLSRCTLGETIEIHAFRRDELMPFKVTLAAGAFRHLLSHARFGAARRRGSAAQRVAARPALELH
jgi:predicted metalloprotease with PDZ domain